MKDSRQMLESDLKNIIRVIEGSTSKKFIITHGTYTMSDTARYLKAKLKGNGKTVVLTGSLTPPPLKAFHTQTDLSIWAMQ